jgi:hypothetical protein
MPWWGTALVAVVGTFVGGMTAVVGAAYVQHEEALEARMAEDRAAREAAYFDFMASTEKSLQAVDAIERCVGYNPTGDPEPDLRAVDSAKFRGECRREAQDLLTTFDESSRSLDRVMVYGTTDAVMAALKLNDAVPTMFQGPRGDASETTILHRQSEFRSVMCREIPAVPRDTC